MNEMFDHCCRDARSQNEVATFFFKNFVHSADYHFPGSPYSRHFLIVRKISCKFSWISLSLSDFKVGDLLDWNVNNAPSSRTISDITRDVDHQCQYERSTHFSKFTYQIPRITARYFDIMEIIASASGSSHNLISLCKPFRTSLSPSTCSLYILCIYHSSSHQKCETWTEIWKKNLRSIK